MYIIIADHFAKKECSICRICKGYHGYKNILDIGQFVAVLTSEARLNLYRARNKSDKNDTKNT